MESPVILCIHDCPTILELGKVGFGILKLTLESYGCCVKLAHGGYADEDTGGNIDGRGAAGVQLQALGSLFGERDPSTAVVLCSG